MKKLEIIKNIIQFFSNAGKTSIKKFSPKKSVDSISEYYAVFDNDKGLYQVFSVVNHSRAYNLKEMTPSETKNKNAFTNLKSVLTEQYGIPKEVTKDSFYWLTENGIKIELFAKDFVVKLYNWFDGKEYGGHDYFTCLVYTNLKEYEELVSSEKIATEKKIKRTTRSSPKEKKRTEIFFLIEEV